MRGVRIKTTCHTPHQEYHLHRHFLTMESSNLITNWSSLAKKGTFSWIFRGKSLFFDEKGFTFEVNLT